MKMILNRKEKVFTTFLWITLAGIAVLVLFSAGKKSRDKKFETLSGGNSPASAFQQSSSNQAKIDAFKNTLTRNPDDFNALVGLGDLYFDMKLADEAIELFERAEKLRPDNTHVLNDLGSLYSQLGDSDRSIAKFQAAYDINPSHLTSLFNVGLVYMHNKQDNERALEVFREILSNNPNEKLRQAVLEEMGKISSGRQ